MILGIGVDLCEVARIRRLVEKYKDRFLNRVFTEEEQKKKDFSSLAARYAAKEAMIKALGGYYISHLREVSVVTGERGEPKIVLTGKALSRFKEIGGKSIRLSLSHTKELAIAIVMIEGGEERGEKKNIV